MVCLCLLSVCLYVDLVCGLESGSPVGTQWLLRLTPTGVDLTAGPDRKFPQLSTEPIGVHISLTDG